jgi:DNA-binding FadR family transcriptional regulator
MKDTNAVPDTRAGRRHRIGHESPGPPSRAVGPSSAGIHVPKAADLVAGDIRRQIVAGSLEDGSFLPPERELVEKYQVSRPTLREAVRVLEAQGLLYMQRGRGGGTRVVAPSGTAAAREFAMMLEFLKIPIPDIVTAHHDITASVAKVVAERRTKADLAALKKNLEDARQVADDPRRLAALNVEFHVLLVQRAGNMTLWLLEGILAHLLADVAQKAQPDMTAWGAATPLAGLKHHTRVVESIERQDAEEADARWRAHLRDCAEFQKKVLRVPLSF